MAIEYKLLEEPKISIKAAGDDAGPGEIEGYPSVFTNWDSQGERVVKGAFARDLGDFLKHGFVSVGHEWGDLPMAMPIEAREDDYGLFARARFHSTPRSQDARTTIRERLEAGKSVRLSIGYEVLEDEYIDEGRLLKRIRLHEWSYVTVPANNLATITGAKQLMLEGGPLSAYAKSAEAAVALFVKETQSLEERRAKEGRVLSGPNVKLVLTVIDYMKQAIEALEALVRASEPKADPALVRKLYAEFLQAQARFNGVLA